MKLRTPIRCCALLFYCLCLSGLISTGQAQDDAGGIIIDAEGVITSRVIKKISPKLAQKRLLQAAKQNLPDSVNSSSPLRKVSLPKLEAACRELLEQGKKVTPEIRYLAGITRIDYLFLYPESGDLVIAGPAEGFARAASGHIVGTESGRPPLELEDLLTALRTVRSNNPVSCSIDIVPERLAALRKFLQANSSAASSELVKRRYHRMGEILGMQEVTVSGVPGDSHFARVLVEADYRMKRITSGLEPSNVKGMKSYLSMMQPGANTVQRWYFIPKYDMVAQTEDGLTYQFSGQRVQLLSQQQIANQSGQRRDASKTHPNLIQYAEHFTKHIPKLAEKNPVFAQLQNLFDLTILVTLMERHQLPEMVDWQMKLFLDEEQLPTSKTYVPRKVISEVSYKRHNRGIMLGLVSGGVSMNPGQVLQSQSDQAQPGKELENFRETQFETTEKRQMHWWWD